MRQPKTALLEPHREELLRLRRDGDSVEVLATALRGLGVEISGEALRLWLNRELGRKPIKRRTVRQRFERCGSETRSLGAACVDSSGAVVPVSGSALDSGRTEIPPESKASAADRPSSLILPGETPGQAMRRRLAALDARQPTGNNLN